MRRHAGISGIAFKLADASKPLASVSRVLDKGGRVAFSRGAEVSHIENTGTGVWMPLN